MVAKKMQRSMLYIGESLMCENQCEKPSFSSLSNQTGTENTLANPKSKGVTCTEIRSWIYSIPICD